MTESASRAVVLTGDLVSSTDAGTDLVNKAVGRVSAVAENIAAWPGSGRVYFTRFRGDGWQFLIPRASYSLRALVCIHAGLRAAEDVPLSRISAGVGSVDPVPGGDLSNASGSALIASGRALDRLEKSRLFCVAGEGMTPLHHAIIDLVEEHVMRWTPEQAEATSYYLSPDNPTQKSIARTLHISVQAVHARLKGAGAQALRRAVEAWEQKERTYD
ncbi:hypothetical protein [Nioella aestuarii]|uniref:hypothetical protein n=1 Tax=Nioella aestuarii TaxID=1662864 RepID=UPI003D7FC1B5